MKINNFTLLLILGICFTNVESCMSQMDEKWVEITKKNAISINIAGTTPFIGITYERLLSNRLNVEVGLGVYSIGVAAKYFPFPIFNNKMVLHAAIGTNLFKTPFDSFSAEGFSNTNYVTIGLTYFGKEGFSFALDLGPGINYDFNFNEFSNLIYGNLKLGYRF